MRTLLTSIILAAGTLVFLFALIALVMWIFLHLAKPSPRPIPCDYSTPGEQDWYSDCYNWQYRRQKQP